MKKAYRYVLTGLTVALLCLLVLGQLQRWQLGPRLALYGHDAVVILIIGWVAFNRPPAILKWLKSISWKKYWLEIIAVGWLAIGLIGAATQGVSLMSPVLYLSRLVIYSLAVVVIVWQQPLKGYLHQLKAHQALQLGMIIVGLLITGLGLLQYLVLPDMRFLNILGWDDHYYRLISTQFDPGFTGALLVLTLILLENVTFITQRWQRVLEMVLVLGIALTFSRATYLSLVVALLILAFYTLGKSLKKTLWPLCLIAWLGILIPWLPRPAGEGVKLNRTSTIVARTTRFQELQTEMRLNQWVIGRGVFVPLTPGPLPIPELSVPDHAQVLDNLILFWLTSTGIIGLALWSMVAIKYLWLYRSSRLVIASLAAVAVHSLFNNTLFQPFVWLFLWLSLGETLRLGPKNTKSKT